LVHNSERLIHQKRTKQNRFEERDKQTMKKIVSTLMGLSLALAVAGVSFAQTAPAAKTPTKTEKKTKAPKAKKTKKSASATPSK
jgi:ribosomal protein L12E/L44/L45/RPP1/RPP2